MEVTFTRLAGAAYAVSIQRSDGVVLSLRPAGASSALPHDLAHFIIEDGLGLHEGFWGCVADGAVVSGMSVVAGRRRPHATARSRAVLRAAGQRTTEAEHMVRVVLEIALARLDEQAPARACALINDAWRPPGRSRARLEPRELARLCALVRATQARWQALEPGASLVLRWPARPPKAKASGR